MKVIFDPCKLIEKTTLLTITSINQTYKVINEIHACNLSNMKYKASKANEVYHRKHGNIPMNYYNSVHLPIEIVHALHQL